MKTAVITGGTSGIGRAIADRLGAEGYRLVVVSRSEEKLRVMQRELQLDTHAFCGYRVDFLVPDAVEAAAQMIAREHPALDLLVHSAGYWQSAEIESSDVAVLDRHYQINVRTPYVLTRYLLASLRKNRGQVVFLNSSVSHQHGKAGLSAYVSSKLALKGIADCFRAEVNSQEIRVISVYPGSTATPMQARIQEDLDQEYHPEKLLQPEDIADMVLHALHLPETAEVTELSIRPFQKSL